VDRDETLDLVRDALKAVERAEKLLEGYRPALSQIAPALSQVAPLIATIGHLSQEHTRVALDLRIMRLRLQSVLPPAPPPEDPDQTPVEGARRLSEQLAAVRVPVGKLPGRGRPEGGEGP
jgi:hypothetical protein